MKNKYLIIGIGTIAIILLIIGGIFLTNFGRDPKVSGEVSKMFDKTNKKTPDTIIVSSVIDGDTIRLSTGEYVRLIGLNAPETGEKCSSEAKEELEKLVLGKEVILGSDVEDKDQYDRLLRYVSVDNIFINLELVKLGFAHKYKYGLDIKYSSEFEEAEDEAKENCGCIWQPCVTDNNEIDEQKSGTENEIPNYIKDECFTITEFHFDAAGNDNYNLNDEYVTIKNVCDYSVNTNNWTIKDETSREDHKYYFPDFSIEGENFITLYTGMGVNEFTFNGDKLYWGRNEGNYGAIWNNNGDTLFLRDNQGNLVLSKSYEGYD